MFRKFLPIVVTLVLIMSSVIALDPLGVSQPTDSMAQDDTTVLLRLVHAVPGAGAVDVYADGNLIAPNFEFATATPHLAFPAGDHVLAIREAGDDPSDPAILEQTISLIVASSGYRHATIVVQADAEGAVQFGQYVDDLTPKGLGGSRIHAINAIGDLSAVDFLISNGAPLLENVSFNVPGGTIDPPVGTYELLVAPNGGGVEAAIFEIGEVSLDTNTLYTIILLEDSELQALVLSQPMFADPNADTVLTAFAHASFDAPTVDVYADDVLILKDFAPGTITQHLPIPAGDINLAIREAGTPANSEPAYEQNISLESFSGAATVAAIGSLSESTFSFSFHDDDILSIPPDQARLVVLNSVATGPASLSLDDEDTIVDGLGSFTTSDVMDVPAGIYPLTGTVDGENGPVSIEIDDQALIGGTYYTVVIGLADEAVVALNGTPITADGLSLPGAEIGVSIVSPVDTDDTGSTDDPTTDDSGTDINDTTVEATPTAVPITEVPPTQAPPPAVTAPPTIAQQNIVFGIVNLNAGVNLQCREYPTSLAFSLGLVPNNTQVVVRGWAGPPDVEDGQPFTPVEEGSFETPREVESFEEVWLNIDWTSAEGGTLRCWTRADLLLMNFRNRSLFTPESLFELGDVEIFPPIVEEVPYNYPGGAVDPNAVISPPTPARNDPIGTVNVDAGVSLHLRRMPDAASESLALMPNGSEMYVLGRTTTSVSTEIGQPSVPDWLYVEFTDAGGTTTTGWVSAQYLVITQFGRLIGSEDIELVDEVLAGEVLVEGSAPPPSSNTTSANPNEYLGQVVFINAGSNLNMRDIPSADALVLAAIPANSQVVVIGRNGDGTWLNVRFEIVGEAPVEGWVSSQYIEVTQNGLLVDVFDLPITNDDTNATPVPVTTEEPTE